MNADMKQFWDLNRMYTPLRDQLLEALTDDDLVYSPGGDNPTLGELCREIGEVQYAYARSFDIFEIDFSYRINDDSYAKSVVKLKAWYAQLDAELEAAVKGVTDEDVATRQMERGGYQVPVHISLDILREALLIFYGKVSVYAKAMDLELPQMWRDWIG